MSYNKINPNQPAFPVDPGTDPDGYACGLTIRQEFAGRAMQGLVSALNLNGTYNPKLIAVGAILLADELIAALNK